MCRVFLEWNEAAVSGEREWRDGERGGEKRGHSAATHYSVGGHGNDLVRVGNHPPVDVHRCVQSAEKKNGTGMVAKETIRTTYQ